MKRVLLCLLLMAAVTAAVGQTRRERLASRAAMVDSVLGVKYRKVNYDTAFIGRPDAKLTLRLRTNVSGLKMVSEGEAFGIPMKSSLTTDRKATLSVGVAYQGVAVGMAVNPAKMRGRNNDYELNLNAYSNRYGVDASYQMAKTLSGDVSLGDDTYFMRKGVMKTKMLNISGYYVFNNRRFSYPAAFTQSYVQKRSAGSWLAGFSYQGGSITSTDEMAASVPEMRIYSGHFGLGGGYGYNLVVHRKWLFHLSTLPTLVLFNNSNVTVGGERHDMITKFPDVILTEHAAIIHHFSPKYFAGATAVMSKTVLGNQRIEVSQSKWRVRLFVGMRI